jgi:carbamoyltransferase
MVLEEKMSTFFESDCIGSSPYMTFAPKVHKHITQMFPAVTHYDGTARVQTVNDATDPYLAKLLRAIDKRTG